MRTTYLEILHPLTYVDCEKGYILYTSNVMTHAKLSASFGLKWLNVHWYAFNNFQSLWCKKHWHSGTHLIENVQEIVLEKFPNRVFVPAFLSLVISMSTLSMLMSHTKIHNLLWLLLFKINPPLRIDILTTATSCLIWISPKHSPVPHLFTTKKNTIFTNEL